MSKKLTAEQRISRFIEKNPLKQSDLPKVILYWNTKQKGKEVRHYYNVSTNKVDTLKREFRDFLDANWRRYPGNVTFKGQKYFVAYSGHYPRFLHIRQDSKLGVMRVCQVTIDTTRYHHGEEPRKWRIDEKVSSMFFLKEKGKTPLDRSGNQMFWFSAYQQVWRQGMQQTSLNQKEFVKYLTGRYMSGKSGKHFALFAKDTLVMQNALPVNPYSSYGLYDWLRYSMPTPSPEEVCNDLPPLPKAETNQVSFQMRLFVQQTSKGLVLRYQNYNADISFESYREFWDAHKVRAFRNARAGLKTGWARCQVRKSENFAYYLGVQEVIGKELFQSFPLTKPLFKVAQEEFPEEELVYRMGQMKKLPIIEKLFKANFKGLAKKLSFSSISDEKKLIEEFFGTCPKRGGGLAASLGLNKKQLLYLNKIVEEFPHTEHYGKAWRDAQAFARGTKVIKALMGSNNLAGMDEALFTWLIRAMDPINEDYGLERKVLPVLSMYAGIKLCKKIRKCGMSTEVRVIPPQTKWDSPRSQGGIFESWQLISDTCKLLSDIPEEIRPRLEISRWNSNRELQREHDNAIAFVNARQEEISRARNLEKARMLKKVDEERKKFEAQDEKFIIRLPESPTEIVAEGRALSHCVGGYVDSHVNGRTTILFLREKEFPNTPFYTIEIRDYKTRPSVVQIHGYGNKWLGNNPEAVPFVMRWLRDNEISCSDDILLCLATGYSSYGAKRIEKPVI